MKKTGTMAIDGKLLTISQQIENNNKDLNTICRIYFLTREQERQIMFEEGCRWIERHIKDSDTRHRILTDQRFLFWTIFTLQWTRATRELDGLGNYAERMRDEIENHNLAIASQLNIIYKKIEL